MKPEEKQLLIVVARAVVQCAQWGQNTGINQEARNALSAALARVTSPSHVEQTPAGCIDWKMEALRTARLLADAERIIAEYKAQAIEAARGVAQTPCGECHLQDGEVCDICGRSYGLAQKASVPVTQPFTGTKEAMHYLGAIKVRLELLYEHSTQDARLLEHLSDEIDWVDAEIDRLRSGGVAQTPPSKD